MSRWRRRLMANVADKEAKYLRYWWDAHDGLNELGRWVPRRKDHNGNLECVLSGNVELNTEAGTLRFPPRSYATISGVINLGYRFKIVIDARIVVPPNDDKTGYNFVLMEFNSIQSTNRALDTSIAKLLHQEGHPSMNYKMFGNNNNSLYSFPLNSFPIEYDSILDGVFEFGNEKFDEDNDILWFRANRGKKIYSINPHAPINHDNISNKFLNRGVIGTSYSSTLYSNDVTYRSIKIYVYD